MRFKETNFHNIEKQGNQQIGQNLPKTMSKQKKTIKFILLYYIWCLNLVIDQKNTS